MTRFDPRRRVNRALLVGVSEYDFTEPPHGVPGDLPAVKHNLNQLFEVLGHGRVFGEDEIRVKRSPYQGGFNRALSAAAAEAEGVLLFYFAGHGAIPSGADELFLQMRDARVIRGGHAVFLGAERFTDVLAVLDTSPAQRIVVILDCCNAGNAAWIWEQFRGKRRVLLLMSVQTNNRIDAGDPRTPTPFTGELVELLGGGGELWFRDLADHLRERMARGGYRTLRRELWEPQSRAEHGEDVLLSARAVRRTSGRPGLAPPGGGAADGGERATPGQPGRSGDGQEQDTPEQRGGDDRPQPQPQPEPQPVPEPMRKPEPQPEPRPVPRSDPEPEPRPVPRTDPQPAPQPDPQPAPQPGPQPAPQPEGHSEPKPEPRPAPEPGPQTSPNPGPDPTPNPGPDPTRQPERDESRDLTPPPGPRPALLAALLTRAKAVTAWLRISRPPGLVRPGSRPRRRTVTGVALLLGAAVLGAGVYALIRFAVDGGASCAPPVELRVLADPDLQRTVRAAADAYLTSEENTIGDGCRRSGITVYSAGADDAVDAFRKQSTLWQVPPDEKSNPQRDVGPQPDIWIPASPADVARVRTGQDTDAVARLEPDEEPFAYSPIVLAVPQDKAAEPLFERVGPSLTTMIDELRGRAEDTEVRRPDPEFTDTGLLATIGLYGPGAPDPAVAERRIAPGAPSPTAADLLCTLPDDKPVDERTAALVPEFLLKSGVDCDSDRRMPRIAQYPGDVPGFEPLFVRVRWQGAHRDETDRDEAADGFRAWLTGEPGRAVLARDGFRSATAGRPLLDPEADTYGLTLDPTPLDRSAGGDEMERTLTKYQGANGPGRVQFLLDSSGSMADLWEGPSGGPGLLKQSLGGLGGRDEYGVWAVSGLGERSYETLLPFGRHTRKSAETAVGDRARVRDAEADPHAALLAALDDMRQRGGDRPRLIVYVTDDEDVGRVTGDRLDEVLAEVRSAKVPVAMVSLVGGGCDKGKPDAEISAASGGRCIDADEDLGAALHDEVARTGTGEH
ncbi:substrate-binding domain-containing protein [Streptomyces sp. S.PNR 29]|uniref:caspase family protein n=1 Tax=Streptomyces sp. S.PNR 29 TaxID=2973805 RepID=UPI0025B19A3E|nr:substrate-binding domain-containing protein [Streptomyces sp. S.PNR 29]MDN0200456.1 substrate-binding domain-containing protein [Streptomyces sp. S.PNR 29]